MICAAGDNERSSDITLQFVENFFGGLPTVVRIGTHELWFTKHVEFIYYITADAGISRMRKAESCVKGLSQDWRIP